MSERIRAIHGDSREVLKTLAECSVDSCVCDPPYALTEIPHARNHPYGDGRSIQERVARRGFMGQKWDTGETAFDPEFWREVFRVLKPGSHLVAFSGTRTYHRMVCAIEDAGFEIRDTIAWLFGTGFPKSHNAGNGWGTALKPAFEPIVLARKPLIGTVAANVAEHGTGAINVDGCRVETADDLNGGAYSDGEKRAADATSYFTGTNAGTYTQPLGRWPANVVHDGSAEVVGAFPDAPGQQRAVTGEERSLRTVNAYGDFGSSRNGQEPRGDEGSAARFFYTAKADGDDRLGSKHPTVKPVDLMQWLCRLVTPKGSLILDPFAGTGTTGEAAWREGMRALLIEREASYFADIQRRIGLLTAGPDERAWASIKASGKVEGPGPLFEGQSA